MPSKKFRKKPVIVEAIRFVGNNLTELSEWCSVKNISEDNFWFMMETSNGEVKCERGDWVVKDQGGDFNLCKGGTFSKNYEEIPDSDGTR